jgi:hypothetical protein
LFEILDDLEEKTRPIMVEARQRLAKEKGESALEPHNIGYALAGKARVGLDMRQGGVRLKCWTAAVHCMRLPCCGWQWSHTIPPLNWRGRVGKERVVAQHNSRSCNQGYHIFNGGRTTNSLCCKARMTTLMAPMLRSHSSSFL